MHARATSTPQATERESKRDIERYARLLQEAKAIRGVSLWQDAWRRLRRNWAAMGSLALLGVVGLLALLTPLVPLQSPIYQDMDQRMFLPPNTRAMNLYTKDPKTSQRMRLTHAIELHDKALDALRGQVEKLAAVSNVSTGHAEQLEAARKELAAAQGAHPLERLWHHPGAITRGMMRLRLAVFGDWCIPSLCGTDDLGRDVLARIWWGSRVSLLVGIVATLVSLVIGVSYGATAGYLGGWIDAVMMRLVDVLFSIPFIFVVIFLITILSEDKWKRALESVGVNQITIFYIVIGAIYWLTMARVVRGQIISLKHEQFIDAARTIGASSGRIIFRHLVPNVLGIVIVYLTLTIPSVMLFEAFLSFLGLGVQPPDVSWGLLVNEGIKVITPIQIQWWLVLFPGLTLALTLFALNFLGDGLRDALDPRMKNR